MSYTLLGKYTKEEVDKAISAETAGSSRIKRHLILFKEGDADESPELAAWRAALADDTYGMFSDADGLGAHFLRLVEQIAGLPLQDVSDTGTERTISAFLAADDELASDRDAFADAVLNLNDVLSHRGVRVRLRFYDPDRHREMLESSEMALVLYQTKCGSFAAPELKESYELAREEKNPRRLYVFFRDADGKPLDADCQTLKDGFAETFGSAPCRFENVDTLSLNFLFALESVLGDGAGTFVKLDGRTVVADGLEVGDLTKLPMLEKNAGIAELFSRMEDVTRRFVVQRENCDKNPQDDGLYAELLNLSSEKNRLQDQIDRELKMSFNLAKRLAAISVAQVNETIARARAKVEEGDIKGALEILDGASSALKRRRLLHRAAERAEAEELQIKELKASAEIEYFRVDAVMAYTSMSFEERFRKANGILSSLREDVQAFFALCVVKNKNDVGAILADTLDQLYRLFDGSNLIDESIQVLWQLVKVYQSVGMVRQCKPECLRVVCNLSGLLRRRENQKCFGQDAFESEPLLRYAWGAFCELPEEDKARCAHLGVKICCNLGDVCLKVAHPTKCRKIGDSSYVVEESTIRTGEAESFYKKAWSLCGKYNLRRHRTECLRGLSAVYEKLKDEEKSRKCLLRAIQILECQASGLSGYNAGLHWGMIGCLYNEVGRFNKAEVDCSKALALMLERFRDDPASNYDVVSCVFAGLVEARQKQSLPTVLAAFSSWVSAAKLAYAEWPHKYSAALEDVIDRAAGAYERNDDLEAIAKPRPPRVGSARRADRGGRGATALPGFAIASLVKAESLYRELVSLRRRSQEQRPFATDVTSLAYAIENLATLHERMGKSWELIAEYKELLEIYRQGRETFRMPDILAKIGYQMYLCGRDSEALGCYEELVSARRAELQEKIKEDGRREMEGPAPDNTLAAWLERDPDGESWSNRARQDLANDLMSCAWCKYCCLLKGVTTEHANVSEVLSLMRESKSHFKRLASTNPEKFGGRLQSVESAIARIKQDDLHGVRQLVALMQFKCGRMKLLDSAGIVAFWSMGELATETVMNDIFHQLDEEIYAPYVWIKYAIARQRILTRTEQDPKELEMLMERRGEFERCFDIDRKTFIKKFDECRKLFDNGRN